MVEAVAVEVEAQVGKRGKSRLGQSRLRDLLCGHVLSLFCMCCCLFFNVFVMSNDKEIGGERKNDIMMSSSMMSSYSNQAWFAKNMGSS